MTFILLITKFICIFNINNEKLAANLTALTLTD